MLKENAIYTNFMEESDEDLNINLGKIFKAIWSRRFLIFGVFCCVLAFFILLTFILPPKYKVNAVLYINKSNSSNMREFNPYTIDDASSSGVSLGSDKAMNNEIELMKSELVLDNVIKENNIVYKKKYGIIPNKKEGELLSAIDFYGKGKTLKIENTKNTNIIEIKYTSKNPKLAYGVVSSLITNYIELHKQLNIEKSNADKKLLEEEYAKVKANLNSKLNKASGLPAQSLSGMGNLSAMSAFSNSASRAIGTVKSQYIQGERSQLEVTEESQKLNQLAAKLEWAKMVEMMSDSSKVLVLNQPRLLRPFEKSSPKLLMNIIMGIIFGGLFSLIALIYAEVRDKKLTYSMLSNNTIFDAGDNINTIKTEIFSYNPKKILLLPLTQLPDNIVTSIKDLSNADIVYPSISDEFLNKISTVDKVILISKIGSTTTDEYKSICKVLKNQGKEIIYDITI